MNKDHWINLTPIVLFMFSYELMGAYDFFGLEYFKTFYLSLFFILFILYLFLEVKERLKNKSFYYYKLAIVLFCIIFASGGGTAMLVKNSWGENGYLYIHDGALQTELAAKKLFQGKNFYSEDFNESVFAQWNKDEVSYFLGEAYQGTPALYHYVYLPFYPILSAVVSWPIENIFGFWDQRILLYAAFLASLYLLYKIVKEKEDKLLALTLFGFNPWFVRDVVEGKNDVLILFFLLWIIYLLRQNKIVQSSLVLALAVLTKQTMWLLLPFYFFYLFWQKDNWQESLKFVWQKTRYGIFLGLIILLPFLFWDFGFFWQDIFQYPNGSLATSYPINGFGWSRFLYHIGVIKSVRDYYPFIIWQIVFCLPLAFWLIKYQAKKNSLSLMILAYAIFLACFWFFSRFFQANYIVFIWQLLVISYFLGYNKPTHGKA